MRKCQSVLTHEQILPNTILKVSENKASRNAWPCVNELILALVMCNCTIKLLQEMKEKKENQIQTV